ncbi:MAG: TonB-dependent receptor [Rikenellaceae bacterium]
MKFVKFCLLLLCAAVAITPSFAQKSDAVIVGHIVDAETGKHLPYITVSIEGTTVGCVSDATGHYRMVNVPVGELTVVASAMGYTSQEMTVTMAKNKTVECNFSITEQSINVDQVVVSSTRNATNKKSSATIVNVVSQNLFDGIASATLSETIPYQPGLRFETTCGNCGSSELRINGLGGQYSQILLDSRPIFSSLAGVYGLEMLPVSMIERVEVIRGGGSALYGSSAIGGVVNIITKEPLRSSVTLQNVTNILKDGTPDVTTSINASYVTDDNRAGAYIFGMMRDKGAYDRNGDGYSETSKMDAQTIGFNSFFKPTNYSKITAEYHYISEFRRGGEIEDEDGNNVLDMPVILSETTEQLEHAIHGGSLTYDYLSPNKKSKFKLYASAQSIHRDSYFGADLYSAEDGFSGELFDDVTAFPYGVTRDLTIAAGGQYTYSYGDGFLAPGNLTVGAEYTMNNLDEILFADLPEIKQDVDTYGAYVQNEWTSDKVNFVVGGRLEGYEINDIVNGTSVSGVEFMPRASLRYSPIPSVGLRASYSSGYRAPQAYSEDLHIESVGGAVSYIIMDPDLRPEYSHSISMSTDLYKSFGRVETNLLVEGFYTSLKDAFLLEETDDAGVWLRTNEPGGAYVGGVSADLRIGIPKKFDVQLGYTFQKSRYNETVEYITSEDGEVFEGKDMLRSPDHYGYFTFNYDVTSNFQTSLFGNYTGKMEVMNEAEEFVKTSQDFFDMGLKFAYNFPITKLFNAEVSAGVKNIFDAYQDDLGIRYDRDPGYIYGPTLPRTYFVGVKLAF